MFHIILNQLQENINERTSLIENESNLYSFKKNHTYIQKKKIENLCILMKKI